MIIEGIEVKKGLIIAQPWVELILSGRKYWEMRSTSTQFRGDFALIEKGTGHIVGLSKLIDVLEPLPPSELAATIGRHHVPYADKPELLKWNTPWVLSGTRRINPVPYQHPQGAVIWVNL